MGFEISSRGRRVLAMREADRRNRIEAPGRQKTDEAEAALAEALQEPSPPAMFVQLADESSDQAMVDRKPKDDGQDASDDGA